MAGAIRWTRRALGRVAAVGAVAGGGVLAAGSAAAGGTAAQSSSAAPTLGANTIQLTFMPWWIYWTDTGKAILNEITQQFDQKHPGLHLQALPGPQGGGASTTSVLASMLAGQGPDVVGDCCGAWMTYNDMNAFADLTPYFKKDNIPLTTWSTGQVQAMGGPSGQFGLPIYHGPVVFLYRQDLLDELGLPYPDPEWDYQAAAAFWTKCAGTYKVGSASKWRYGANFWWQSHSWYAQAYLMYGFGGAEMDSTKTKAMLDQPGSVAAGNWVYPLLWAKSLGASTGTVADGSAIFETSGGWNIPRNVTNYNTRFKWDYVPVPKFPKGRATFANNDFWGMNAASKHLDGAWEVLKWLTYEDDWQRFCMKATLLAPCKVSLWQEFETQLIASAPLLENKGLKWFRDAAEGGYGYPEEFFKYQSPQADSILGQTLGKVFDQKLSVEEGFRQAPQQVDALEVAGAAESAAQQQIQKVFPAQGPSVAVVPPGI